MRQDDLGRLLHEAFRSFEAGLADSFSERGLVDVRPSFTSVFNHIDPNGTRLTTLARRAAMTKQGMADIVGEMERQGLARRAEDPEDGRARLVLLTAKGRRRRAEARKAVDRVEARFRRELGERKYEALRGILGELREEAAG